MFYSVASVIVITFYFNMFSFTYFPLDPREGDASLPVPTLLPVFTPVTIGAPQELLSTKNLFLFVIRRVI